MSRPVKLSDLISVIHDCIEAGQYLDTFHATQRLGQRVITRPEILYVLKNGHHEKRKDHFDETHQAWNYAVKGKTIDKRELRVVVSFDEAGMLIITAIDLGK